MDWRDITYLKRGNHRQRQAWTALHSLNLPVALADYAPVLAGTIPLGIDIYGSDLDILCQAADLEGLAAQVRQLFGGRTGFTAQIKPIRGQRSLVAEFEHAGFPIQIFAQNTPVERQNAYRHLLVEYRLLETGGDPMREAIRELKLDGLKTEPAFAQLLGLEGDPYQALLDLEMADDAAIQRLCARFTPPADSQGIQV